MPAILDIWYPGTQGGTAVANLLFGEVSPGGKLPFTWPRTVGQVPMVYSHTCSHEPEKQARRYWDEESTPLFPFGYGLSYAPFRLQQPDVDRDAIAADETLTVNGDVTNTGERRSMRWSSSTFTSDLGWRHVRCANSKGSRASLLGRANRVRCSSRWDRRSCATGVRRCGLDHRRVDLRPMGRRRLDGAAVNDLRGDEGVGVADRVPRVMLRVARLDTAPQ